MSLTIIGEPKYKYGQQYQVTVRNHNRSTALERSVLKYWEGGSLNRFYRIPTSPSATVMAQNIQFVVRSAWKFSNSDTNRSSRETNKSQINTMIKQRWGLDRNNVLRPTPGGSWGVEQQHWNTGEKKTTTVEPRLAFLCIWLNYGKCHKESLCLMKLSPCFSHLSSRLP